MSLCALFSALPSNSRMRLLEEVVGPPNRMANLFEEAPKTMFDAVEDSEPEPEPVPVPKPPVPIGSIMINGQPAQLVEQTVLDNTRTQYKVILDSTGELKSFVSPPATVTGRD